MLGELDLTPVRPALLERRRALVGPLGGGVDIGRPRAVPDDNAVETDRTGVAPIVATQPPLQRPVERRPCDQEMVGVGRRGVGVDVDETAVMLSVVDDDALARTTTTQPVTLATALGKRGVSVEPLREGVVLVDLGPRGLELPGVPCQFLFAESRLLADAQRGLLPRRVEVVVYRFADRVSGRRLAGDRLTVPLGAVGVAPPVATQMDGVRRAALVPTILVVVTTTDVVVAGAVVGPGAHEHLPNRAVTLYQVPSAVLPRLVRFLVAVVGVTLEILVIAELALQDDEPATLGLGRVVPPHEATVFGGFVDQVVVTDDRTALVERRRGHEVRLVEVVPGGAENRDAVCLGHGVVGVFHLAVQAQTAVHLAIPVHLGGVRASFGGTRLGVVVQRLRQTHILLSRLVGSKAGVVPTIKLNYSINIIKSQFLA